MKDEKRSEERKAEYAREARRLTERDFAHSRGSEPLGSAK